MVICAAKQNMSMYQLLRDRSIDEAIVEDAQELCLFEED